MADTNTMLRTFWTRIGEILKARRKAPQLPIHRDENIDEELPDRIVNPDMYRPLLAATDSGKGNSQSESQPNAGVNSLVAYGSI